VPTAAQSSAKAEIENLWRAMIVAPPVDAVRPTCCPHCGSVGRHLDGDVVIEGNGERPRQVVVPTFQDGLRLVRITCWSRRFLCTRCGKSIVVLPSGVSPGCLYSVAAMVVVWWKSWSLMRADARHNEVDNAQVSVDSRRDDVGEERRWRTPYRWAARLSAIFTGHHALNGGWRQEVARALVMLAVQARDLAPEALARQACRTHRTYDTAA
jgi:hypothetical protein